MIKQLDPRQGFLFGGGAGVAAAAPPPQLQFNLPSRGNGEVASLRLEVFQAQGEINMSSEDIEFSKQELGLRWRTALIQRYEARDRAKKIACDFEVSVPTAKSWIRQDHPPAPQAGNLGRAAHLFGLKILAEVLLPDAKWLAVSDVDEKLQGVQSRLRQLQDEIVLLREV